jgi:hypothetical protein
MSFLDVVLDRQGAPFLHLFSAYTPTVLRRNNRPECVRRPFSPLSSIENAKPRRFPGEVAHVVNWLPYPDGLVKWSFGLVWKGEPRQPLPQSFCRLQH